MGNSNCLNSNVIQSQPELNISEKTKDLSISPPHKIKPFFPYSTKMRCEILQDFPSLNKHRPKLLSRINFANNTNQNPGSKVIRSLCRVLSDAKRSSDLSISLSDLNTKQLKHILNSTNHLKKVNIDLTVYGHNSHLSKSLKRVGKNKDLSQLNVYYSMHKHGDQTCCIHQQLKQLRKLEYLGLPRPDSAYNFESFSEFLACLKVMQNLHALKLEFLGPIFRDTEVLLVPRYLDGCQRLHRRELSFQNLDPLSEKTLDSLQAALVKLIKLEYLEVKFCGIRRIPGKDLVNKFLSGLIVLKGLKKLVFNSERSLGCYSPDPAFKESVKELRKLKDLTHLEINNAYY